MNSEFKYKNYQALLEPFQISETRYSVINEAIALERAAFYLFSALELMNNPTNHEYFFAINALLIASVDLGSAEAAFHLSQNLLFSCQVPFSPCNSFIFLKLAADRGHLEATYQLACCYAGIDHFKLMQSAGESHLNQLSSSQRTYFAEYYFKQGIQQNHRESIEELIILYAYGGGYIEKNVGAFIDLCEDLTQKGNQSVTLGYGAWLAGMTVEGEDALPEAVKFELDYSKALQLLIQSANGQNMEMSQHAICLIFLGQEKGLWHFLAHNELSALLTEMLEKGNHVLALYYAWYAIPVARRPKMPSFMEQKKLTCLTAYVEVNEEKAMYFLDKVLLSTNKELSEIAKDLFLKVFAFHD